LNLAGAALVVSCVLTAATAGAQLVGEDQASGQATDVTRAEIAAIFASLGDAIDLQVKVVDAGGGTNVAVGVLERGPMQNSDGAVRGLVHHQVAEVYYVLEGSGILVTGGALADAREIALESATVTELVGPSSSGITRGGTSRRVAAGDVVVIPAGIFHGFSQIEETIRYLSIRVDPDQVLPAGYVNPLLADRGE
jgi:mannose-6-phosphate isomerase-like protein (cupin superfamily)